MQHTLFNKALGRARELEHARLAPTTRVAYQTGWRAWLAFAEHTGMVGVMTDEHTLTQMLRAFIGWLWDTRGPLAASTVQSYVAGVGHHLKEQGCGESFVAAHKTISTVYGTLEGIRRLSPAPHRAPGLTIYEIGQALAMSWRRMDPLDATAAALVVLAGTLMLRIHEYIPHDGELLRQRGQSSAVVQRTANPALVVDHRMWRTATALQWTDIRVDKGVAHIMQRKWKYSRPGDGRSVTVRCRGRTSPWMCAECWLSALSGLHARDKPLWIAQVPGGQLLTAGDITQYIRQAARQSGRGDWNQLTGHSLRRGAASDLYHTSGNTTVVRALGRWRSETGIQPYLAVQPHQVTNALEQQHQQHLAEPQPLPAPPLRR